MDLRTFLAAVAKLSETEKTIDELQEETLRKLRALVNYPLLARSFTSPGLKNIRQTLLAHADQKSQNPDLWLTALSVVLLGSIGKLSASSNPTETSLKWIDDWKLELPFCEKLRSIQNSEIDASQAMKLLQVVILNQNWYVEYRQKKIEDLLRSWFGNPQVQEFLRINRFENILWYDHQSFQEFLWWLELMPILQESATSDASLASIGETVLGVQKLIVQIEALDEVSECQVEKLLSSGKSH